MNHAMHKRSPAKTRKKVLNNRCAPDKIVGPATPPARANSSFPRPRLGTPLHARILKKPNRKILQPSLARMKQCTHGRREPAPLGNPPFGRHPPKRNQARQALFLIGIRIQAQPMHLPLITPRRTPRLRPQIQKQLSSRSLHRIVLQQPTIRRTLQKPPLQPAHPMRTHIQNLTALPNHQMRLAHIPTTKTTRHKKKLRKPPIKNKWSKKWA